MMKKVSVDEVVIDGQTYVPKGAEYTSPKGDVKIVVLQRGWVAVGRLAWNQPAGAGGREGTLTNAKIIRVWGTSRGLGEIAEGGPTSKTVLDHAGTVQFHEQTAVLIVSCVGSAWASLV